MGLRELDLVGKPRQGCATSALPLHGRIPDPSQTVSRGTQSPIRARSLQMCREKQRNGSPPSEREVSALFTVLFSSPLPAPTPPSLVGSRARGIGETDLFTGVDTKSPPKPSTCPRPLAGMAAVWGTGAGWSCSEAAECASEGLRYISRGSWTRQKL